MTLVFKIKDVKKFFSLLQTLDRMNGVIAPASNTRAADEAAEPAAQGPMIALFPKQWVS